MSNERLGHEPENSISHLDYTPSIDLEGGELVLEKSMWEFNESKNTFMEIALRLTKHPSKKNQLRLLKSRDELASRFMGLTYITLTHPELLPREKANIITTSLKDYDTERVQKLNSQIPEIEFARQPNKRKQVFSAVSRLVIDSQRHEEDNKIDLVDDLTASFRQSISSDMRRIFAGLGLKNQDSISEEQSD